MVRTSNYTHEGMQNEARRYFWAVQNIIVVLSSLIGDTTILLATTRYSAIRLNKILVVTIQHIAICDLLLAVFRILPTIISLFANNWILGTTFCHLQAHVGWICFSLAGPLVCVLTTSKLLVVKFPIRARTWSGKIAHRLCAAFWALNIVAPWQVRNIFFAKANAIFFVYFKYSCDFDTRLTYAPHWFHDLIYVYLAFTSVIVNVVVMVTSLWLLLIAKRSAQRRLESLRWQGVIPVILTAFIYIASSFPLAFVIATQKFVFYEKSTWGTVTTLQNLNIMANFFIYSLTMRSFREFVRMSLKNLIRGSTLGRKTKRCNGIERIKVVASTRPMHGQDTQQSVSTIL